VSTRERDICRKLFLGAPVKIWAVAIAIAAFSIAGVSRPILEGFAIGVTVGYVFLAG
jgi:hypothetical protein